MSSNYFESEEWKETKRIVDGKISKEVPLRKESKTYNDTDLIQAMKFFTGKEPKPQKIDWDLVRLFKTR